MLHNSLMEKYCTNFIILFTTLIQLISIFNWYFDSDYVRDRDIHLGHCRRRVSCNNLTMLLCGSKVLMAHHQHFYVSIEILSTATKCFHCQYYTLLHFQPTNFVEIPKKMILNFSKYTLCHMHLNFLCLVSASYFPYHFFQRNNLRYWSSFHVASQESVGHKDFW